MNDNSLPRHLVSLISGFVLGFVLDLAGIFVVNSLGGGWDLVFAWVGLVVGFGLTLELCRATRFRGAGLICGALVPVLLGAVFVVRLAQDIGYS